ncbi:MAG: NAD(P)H-hydrate dehydratase [Lachnospiraceae bacterium]|nr:NAD(P)H-hydrate dehydratase [Lachnospiraceae bacterium]
MRYIASGEEMAGIDAYTIDEIGVPQLVLMERAALCVYDYIREHFDEGAKVLVVCESGNNGGDGVAVARLLFLGGFDVELHFIGGLSKQSEAFKVQMNMAKKLKIKMADEIVNYGYDVVVDAIFGVGLKRAVSGKQAEAVKLMNGIEGFKLAVDMPTGIDTDTGFILGTAFKADVTLTFGLMKTGLLSGMGNEYAGKVKVCDIGFPKQAVDYVNPRLYTYDSDEIEELLPFRRGDSHKGSFGRVSVIGGSFNMAGAPMFAAEAAYRMGCGLVRVCTVDANREIVQTRLPEAVLTTFDPEDPNDVRRAVKDTIDWSDVIVLGPGLSREEYAALILEGVLHDYDKKLIVDADGLNLLAKVKDLLLKTKAEVVLTPHLAEMSRLNGEKIAHIKEHKYEMAKAFASEYKCVVALKDARTVVSDGSRQAYLNTTGDNGMATGGSGDVLTGIIAGLMAQGLSGMEAASLGSLLHGLAGESASHEMGLYGVIAGDIVRNVSRVIERFRESEKE